MLDEPFAGIDPVTVQSIQVIIRELADDGIAILITDHAAREILQITDRTYVVSEGQILISGTSDQITQNETVRAKYLGDISFAKDRSVSPTRPSRPAANRVDKRPATSGDDQITFKAKPKKRIVTLKSNDID